MKKLAILVLALLMLSACQGQPPPQIRFGDISAMSERRELASEVTKTAIKVTFGNEIKAVRVEATNALQGLRAGDFDVALFVQGPRVAAVPSKCLHVNQPLAKLGPVAASESASTVVRCDLAAKDSRVFDFLTKFQISPELLDQTLTWRHEHQATLAESAKHYLHLAPAKP